MPRIISALREAAAVLTGRKNAGRNLTVLPDDVFLVSYPRSGNTWARFLVGNLLFDEPVTFANVDTLIPEIYLFPDRILRQCPRPRMLKSHECFDPRYKRVIYIVRDPRDVAVSYYHYAIKRNLLSEDYPIAQFIPRFLAAEFDVQWSWAANWQDHVMSWYRMRQGMPGFLFLHYETLLSETRTELARVSSFIDLDLAPDRLSSAVELSSADRMRDLEKTQAREWRLTESTRLDRPFVRFASSNNWQNTLPAAAVAQIESAWGPAMQELGYPLSSKPGVRRPELAVAAVSAPPH